VVVLAAMAMVTLNARLGLTLPAAPALDAALLARLLAPLQRLSRGRVVLAARAGQQPFLRQVQETLATLDAGSHLPVLVVGGDDRSLAEATKFAAGLVCPGDPAGMEPVFKRARELRAAALPVAGRAREADSAEAAPSDPFELWVQAPPPEDGPAWRALRTACEAAGATGVIVPFGSRLLDMVRLGDDAGEIDRSDLQLSLG